MWWGDPGPRWFRGPAAFDGGTGAAAPDPGADALRAGVPFAARTAVGVVPPPRRAVRARSPACSVVTPIGGGQYGSRSTTYWSRRSDGRPILRRRLPRRAPDRLRCEANAGQGSCRSVRPAHQLNDASRCRPVFGDYELFQTDPHWHDLLWFHECFHGGTGAGLGASHQTGWTGLVAECLLHRHDRVE